MEVRTLADLARVAGVSAGTVSRALAGKSLVNAETRERIQALARQYGFRPNQMASKLRSRRTGVIGVVIPLGHEKRQQISDPFFLTLLGPLVVASVIANIVIRQFLGYEAVYQMPRFDFVSGWEVFFYVGLGVLAGMLAPLFLRLLDTAKERFGALPVPLFLRLALGGLVVGVLSLQVPQVWGNGYSVVNSILHTQWAWQALAMVLVFKVLATASSAGSGAVGGVFTPTLFVGAALGSLYGLTMNALAPATASVASSYAVVGMGAFLAATTYAPLMSILMIFEMTLSYEVMLPLMLACISGFVIAQRIRPASVYAKSLASNRLARETLKAAPVGPAGKSENA